MNVRQVISRPFAPPSAGIRAKASTNMVLSVVSIGIFMTILDLFIVNIAFPDIRKDFAGSSLSQLSWILNGYAIVFAALLVPAGRFADRYGQKRLFAAGLVLFTIASALCAVATGPVTLVIARLLQAGGAAALTPASLGILLNAVSVERRPWALGIWTAVGAVAAAAGPTIGGLLVTLSWRWVFLVNVPVGLVAIVLALRVLPDQQNDASGPLPDLIGSVLLIAGVAFLSLGIVEGPDWGWSSVRVAGSFVVAAAAIVLFIYRSMHHPSPIVEPALVRVRSFAIASAAAFMFNAAFAVMLLGLVQYMTEVWGYTALHTGLAISPGPLVVPIAATRGQWLVKRFGASSVATAGSLLFAVAAGYWLLQTGSDRSYLVDLLPGLLLAGTGFGITLPVILTTASRSLPPQRFGTGSAVVTMARQLGTVFGISILIVLLDSESDPVAALHHGWFFMMAAAVATAIACLALRIRPQRLAPAGAVA